jgi:hypothetical protein
MQHGRIAAVKSENRRFTRHTAFVEAKRDSMSLKAIQTTDVIKYEKKLFNPINVKLK